MWQNLQHKRLWNVSKVQHQVCGGVLRGHRGECAKSIAIFANPFFSVRGFLISTLACNDLVIAGQLERVEHRQQAWQRRFHLRPGSLRLSSLHHQGWWTGLIPDSLSSLSSSSSSPFWFPSYPQTYSNNSAMGFCMAPLSDNGQERWNNWLAFLIYPPPHLPSFASLLAP